MNLRNRQSTFSPLTPYLPLPKYFESEWSYAQYRIPVQSSHISLTSSTRSPTADAQDEERCVVGWIEAPSEGDSDREPVVVYQLIALTFVGGWYRLSLPNASGFSSSTASTSSSHPKSTSGPRQRTASSSSTTGRSDKGKEKEKERDKESRVCVLKEFRRYGRWDGWG